MTSRRTTQFCGSTEHSVDRRSFLKSCAATALGVSLGGIEAAYDPVFAAALREQKRSVLLLWLAGGSSQFETWDPKPGRPTGGPFKSIPTAVPGTHVCELLPRVSKLTDRLTIIRSLSTGNGSHPGGSQIVQTGRAPEANLVYPDFGTVISKELAQKNSEVPDFVSLYLATEGRQNGTPNPGFLGGGYSAMKLEQSLRPKDITAPLGLSDRAYDEREDLRRFLTDRFQRRRRAAKVQGYNNAYARVRGLMKSDTLFDIEKEPTSVRDRYGKTDFGQHALIGRRLIEAGVPMVKVSRAWWDSHSDNFESHRELVSEFDRVFNTLFLDLEERGLLETTTIIILSEFGRTPNINPNVGRDHFATAWSCAFAGRGVKHGLLYGKTDEDGRTVADGKIGPGELVGTIYKAAGIDPHTEYYVGERPVPLMPEHTEAVDAVLI